MLQEVFYNSDKKVGFRIPKPLEGEGYYDLSVLFTNMLFEFIDCNNNSIKYSINEEEGYITDDVALEESNTICNVWLRKDALITLDAGDILLKVSVQREIGKAWEPITTKEKYIFTLKGDRV